MPSASIRPVQVPRIPEYVDDERVSSELAPLLRAVYAEVQREPANLRALARELRRLLEYLASPTGRTNANCWAADLFFMEIDKWERDWEHLPESYQDLLGDLGGALHDTVSAPEIAESFSGTPEQLLAQLEQFGPPEPPA
jgi:hypothetical protein